MKLKYIAFSALMAFTTMGCNESKFLDIRPNANLDNENLNSPDGVEALVNAAYAALQGPAGQTESVWFVPMTNWSYGEVRSDNAYKGGGGTGDAADIHNLEIFVFDATFGNADSKWYQLYKCVQRCNLAINFLKQIDETEFPLQKRRIAEMRLLRAHFYFELSRLFNRIPYFDENVSENEYPNISNVEFTRDEILGKIAQEMLDAAAELPETQPEIGRVNKYAALAYAAKVKLYQAYKQDPNTNLPTGEINTELLTEVVSLCEELEGKYDLLDDFQQLDLLAYENGKESVFAVQYSMNDGSADAGRINWSNLLNAPKGPYNGDGFFLPSQNLINAFKTDENGLPMFDSFNDKNLASSDNVDPRLDFIVGRPGITWKTYKDGPCQADWVRDQGAYGQYCTKRFYVSPESSDMYKGWPWGASGLNWQIIRYAHVLLWKAEALVELGDGASLEEARQIINRIRHRAATSAWVKDFSNPANNAARYKIEEYPATGWSQDYARQALRFETRIETAMEGERFFDLVRWGIANQTMDAYILKEKERRVYYVNADFQEKKHEYLPITQPQYNFSGGKYKQNPGYGDF